MNSVAQFTRPVTAMLMPSYRVDPADFKRM